jgi:hypothetical protein
MPRATVRLSRSGSGTGNAPLRAVGLVSALADLPLGDELVAWLRTHERFEAAWDTCPRGDWLLVLALFGGVDRRKVVEAARRSAALAVARNPSRVEAERALACAAGWVDGTRNASDCWAAGFASSADAGRTQSQTDADVTMAAACVAFACDDAADDSYYAARGHAAEAAHLAARSFGARARHAHLAMAILVRELVSAAEAESGLVRTSASPWELPDPSDSEILEFPYLAYAHGVIG